MIQQLLIKYLIQNGRLGIPEIGMLHVKRIPAQVISGGREIKGPEFVITYQPEPVPADKHLFEFLTMETSSDEVTVIGQFNEWTQDLKNQIFNRQTVELPFIGKLLLDEDGQITHTAPESTIGYQSVALPEGIVFESKLAAEEEEELEKKGTSWRIYAIILFLLASAAIAYYYL